jgi:hypothetical protein
VADREKKFADEKKSIFWGGELLCWKKEDGAD